MTDPAQRDAEWVAAQLERFAADDLHRAGQILASLHTPSCAEAEDQSA